MSPNVARFSLAFCADVPPPPHAVPRDSHRHGDGEHWRLSRRRRANVGGLFLPPSCDDAHAAASSRLAADRKRRRRPLAFVLGARFRARTAHEYFLPCRAAAARMAAAASMAAAARTFKHAQNTPSLACAASERRDVRWTDRLAARLQAQSSQPPALDVWHFRRRGAAHTKKRWRDARIRALKRSKNASAAALADRHLLARK